MPRNRSSSLELLDLRRGLLVQLLLLCVLKDIDTVTLLLLHNHLTIPWLSPTCPFIDPIIHPCTHIHSIVPHSNSLATPGCAPYAALNMHLSHLPRVQAGRAQARDHLACTHFEHRLRTNGQSAPHTYDSRICLTCADLIFTMVRRSCSPPG